MESNIFSACSSSNANVRSIELKVSIGLVKEKKNEYIHKQLHLFFFNKCCYRCLLYNADCSMLRNMLISIQSCIGIVY